MIFGPFSLPFGYLKLHCCCNRGNVIDTKLQFLRLIVIIVVRMFIIAIVANVEGIISFTSIIRGGCHDVGYILVKNRLLNNFILVL